MTQDELPSYSITNGNGLEQPSSSSSRDVDLLPPTFIIGSCEYPPLVTIPELKAHLTLLGAFHKLKTQTVQQADVICRETDLPVPPPEAKATLSNEGLELGFVRVPEEVKWSLYLNQAVFRFERWVMEVLAAGTGKIMEKEYPPIDVLMVWHSYCLNPRIYYEDGLLRWPRLQDGMDVIEMAKMVDPGTYSPLPPTDDALKHFGAFSIYHDSDVPSPSDMRPIRCPKDGHVFQVPWMTGDSTGYAQAGFKSKCPTCGLEVTKEALGVYDWSCVVSKWVDTNLKLGGKFGKNTVYLNGTLLHPSHGLPQTGVSELFNSRLFGALNTKSNPNPNTNPVVVAGKAEWKIEGVARIMTQGLRQVKPTVRVLKIASYYSQPFFSIDLVGAVNRQASFVEKMAAELRWTTPGRFDQDPTLLVRSVARYHAFLDLMQSSPATFCVPTLDIDLSWHTHQLKSVSYRDDTYKALTRIPDHDDKVEENTLSTAFDTTARAWKARFGVPYSVCGCVLPEDGVFSKIKNKIRDNSSKNENLTTRSPVDAEASHPSEHNSILLLNHPGSEKARKKREKQFQERLEKEEKLAKSGKGDQWLMIRQANRDNGTHSRAFDSSPRSIPYWGVSPLIYGAPLGMGYGLAGCGGRFCYIPLWI